MNIKAKNIITVSIMKCNIIPFTAFRKRVLVFLMAIVLCFNTICKPDETKATEVAVGAILTTALITGIVTNVLGCVIPDGWEAIKRYFREDNPDATDQEIEDYFRTNITVNGDGNYVLSDSALELVKGFKDDIKNDVNCVIGYTFPSSTIDPLLFSTKAEYDGLKKLIDDNPDYVFSYVGWSGGYQQYTAFKKDDIAGLVCPTLDGALVGNVYDSNWEAAIGYGVAVDKLGTPCIIINYVYGNMWHSEWIPLEGTLESEIEKYTGVTDWTSPQNGWMIDLTKEGHGILRWNLGQNHHRLASNLVKSFDNIHNILYNRDCVAIECYKTLNDLKRGTNFAVLGGYLPQYANEPKQVVTPDDINTKPTKPFNNTNNDDDGGGSSGNNNNNNNNDDSGSGGFWDNLGDGVLGLFKGIGKLLGRAIEGILELFDQLLSAITDVISYLDEDIAKFFKDVLSFMPEPWVKTITLGLSLVIIGFVITLLRGGK